MAKKSVDESPMMKQFRELKEKHPEALLLFRCGDFYETYQDDAKVAAKVLGITLTWRTPQKRHAPGDYTDAMAGFPHNALDVYLPKLIRAGKRVAICDQLEDPKLTKRLVKRGSTELTTEATTNNSNSEDKTMTKNQNESANVQAAAQVSNNTKANESVDVAELSMDDIKPRVTKQTHPQPLPVSEGSSQKRAVTMPLGKHGTLVIAGVGGKPRDRFDLEKDKPSDRFDLKKDMPKVQDSVAQVRLVVYTTKHGDQAPRIEGFGGDADPRWKRHYDEKVRLAEEKKKADAFNEKLQEKMKGKKKEERDKLRKQWKSVGSDPFGASYFTDRTTGEKHYQMILGAKYMDAAQQLTDAYNSGDAQAIAQAEQAVVDVKNGIVSDYKAQKAARAAEREAERKAKRESEKSVGSGSAATEPSFTLDQVAAMLGRLLPEGAASTEDIKKLLQAV